MVYCPNCGTANRDGSAFCNECGTKLPASGSIKCPMCSTLNPSGKVFCDNCGARLVPALAEPAAPDQSTPSHRGISLPSKSEASGSNAGPAENVPDWMRDASSEEQPDWLQRLAGNSTGAADDQSMAEPAASADTPDWLSNLSASAPAKIPLRPAPIEPPSTTPADQVAADDVPDWMSNLRAAAPSIDDSQASTPQPESAETPDRLNNLNADEPAQPPVESSASSNTTDWPRNLSAGAPAATEPAAVRNLANDMPEWLSKLAGNAPTVPMTIIKPDLPASTPAPVDKPAPADVPDDWLSRLVKTAPTVPEPASASTSEPPSSALPEETASASAELSAAPAPTEEAGASDMPDWLKEFGGTPTSESTNAADVPDWLGNLAASMPADTSEPSAESAIPAWLKEGDQPAVLGEEPAQVSDVPDWLREFQSTAEPAAATSQPASTIEPTVEPAATTPEWLAAPQAVLPMQEESQSIEPAAEPVAAIPDWLAALQAAPSLQSEEARSAPIKPATEPVAKIDQPAQPIEKAVGPKVKIEKPIQPIQIEPSAPVAAKPIEAAQPTLETEMPEWLRGMSQAPAAPKPRGSMVPIPPELPPELREEPAVAADLPAWLQSLRKGVPAGSAPASSGLAQGEIPEWLEALRPQIGEAHVIEEGPEAETEGVLAGLAQTLPSIPLMGEVHGTPANLKAETSAQDLARAGLFQELLARGAATPKPVAVLAGRGANLRRRVTQWVIAVVVLLALGIPAWLDLNKTLGVQLLPHLDKLPTTAVQSASQTIDQLPDGSTALVIFDYDPTQAGEMNPIADVLLRHLIARGVDVTAASLNPLGSSIAQAQWLKASGQLSKTVQFENLGYVAGQSIGVQQLLQSNPLVSVVIDLAASPDSLRWWVEQIAASNLQVPLIAGLSAGAQPLALPYIRSGQVTGTVVGLVGALVYAQYTGLSPLSTDSQSIENQIHLEAQTLAHWMLALIILIGMLSALFSRGGRRSAA